MNASFSRSRPLFLVIALFTIAALFLTACGSSTGGSSSSNNSNVTVHLGYFPNLTHAVALVGVAQGTFQKALGSNATLDTKIFSVGPALIEALFANQIDIGYVGPNPAINGYVKSKGAALRVIAGAASGGALFIVRPGGLFIQASLLSLERLAVGYFVSLLIGLILGILIGRFRVVEETVGSLVLGLQALPSICWLPLAILWFGLSEQAMIFIVVMGAVFSITLGVDNGVKNTPPVYLKAARNMGARGLRLYSQVIIPAALPAVVSGLKQGWTFAWRSLMAAELIYESNSLGNLLQQGRDLNDTAQVIAVMLVIVVIGVTIDTLVFGPLERGLRERWGLAK